MVLILSDNAGWDKKEKNRRILTSKIVSPPSGILEYRDYSLYNYWLDAKDYEAKFLEPPLAWRATRLKVLKSDD